MFAEGIRKKLYLKANWIYWFEHILKIIGYYLFKRCLSNYKLTDKITQVVYSTCDADVDRFENEAPILGVWGNRLQIITETKMRGYLTGLISAELHGCNSVLEAGCGRGISTVLLKRQFPEKEFMGFDYTPNRVKWAQEYAKSTKTKIGFFEGDMRNINLPTNSVDCVYTTMLSSS